MSPDGQTGPRTAVLPSHWLGTPWAERDVGSSAIVYPKGANAGGRQLIALLELILMKKTTNPVS